MIIKYIENKHGFLFFSKDKLAVVTDEGEGSVEGNLDEKVIRELNDKLKDFNIESREDFLKLKEICGENYSVVEQALLKCSNKLWFNLNSDANMIPRPLAMILRKDSGIREFYTISFDCGDFQQASFINLKIFEALNSKLNSFGFKADDAGFYHGLDDKKVLDILAEVVKETNKGLTFNVKIGINLKNSKVEDNKNIFDYVVSLVFNYNVSIAINPLGFSDKSLYEKLKEKVVGDCYLAIDHLEDFDIKKVDFMCIKQNNIADVFNISKDAKDRKLNIIFDGDADVCVGFGFPILRIDLRDKNADRKVARVINILEEIKEYKLGLKNNSLPSDVENKVVSEK